MTIGELPIICLECYGVIGILNKDTYKDIRGYVICKCGNRILFSDLEEICMEFINRKEKESKSQKDKISAILNSVKALDKGNGASIGSVKINCVLERRMMKEEEFDTLVARLREAGELFEPTPNFLKVV